MKKRSKIILIIILVILGMGAVAIYQLPRLEARSAELRRITWVADELFFAVLPGETEIGTWPVSEAIRRHNEQASWHRQISRIVIVDSIEEARRYEGTRILAIWADTSATRALAGLNDMLYRLPDSERTALFLETLILPLTAENLESQWNDVWELITHYHDGSRGAIRDALHEHHAWAEGGKARARAIELGMWLDEETLERARTLATLNLVFRRVFHDITVTDEITFTFPLVMDDLLHHREEVYALWYILREKETLDADMQYAFEEAGNWLRIGN